MSNAALNCTGYIADSVLKRIIRFRTPLCHALHRRDIPGLCTFHSTKCHRSSYSRVTKRDFQTQVHLFLIHDGSDRGRPLYKSCYNRVLLISRCQRVSSSTAAFVLTRHSISERRYPVTRVALAYALKPIQSHHILYVKFMSGLNQVSHPMLMG